MALARVFVGLGGNIGDSVRVLNHTLEEMDKIDAVHDLKASDFYQTTSVGPIPQDDYVNAVCTFKTSLGQKELFCELQRIEKKFGKTPKPKDSPRVLDLDLLFFGIEAYNDEELQIPHSQWEERMFVVIPLADLVTEITVPDSSGEGEFRQINLKEMLRDFPNIHNETVKFLTKPMFREVHV